MRRAVQNFETGPSVQVRPRAAWAQIMIIPLLMLAWAMLAAIIP